MAGTEPAYFPIRNWTLADGDGFGEEAVRQGERVAVVGASLASQLFAAGAAVGRRLAVGESRVTFRVVGVLDPKGPGLNGEDQDNMLFVPASAYRLFLGSPYQPAIGTLHVKAAAGDGLDELADRIRELLRSRHKLSVGREEAFTVRSLDAVLQVTAATTQAFSALLAAVASVSLVVGGIGIMNIMLVTVTERTREIGLRKAIGATPAHIRFQFLLEATLISGTGSCLGLLFGTGGGLAAQRWLDTPVVITGWSVVLALGMSLGIGLASGAYPAHAASRLQPLDALRSA